MSNSLISVSLRDELPLNELGVNTESYHNTADMLQINVFMQWYLIFVLLK